MGSEKGWEPRTDGVYGHTLYAEAGSESCQEKKYSMKEKAYDVNHNFSEYRKKPFEL